MNWNSSFVTCVTLLLLLHLHRYKCNTFVCLLIIHSQFFHILRKMFCPAHSSALSLVGKCLTRTPCPLRLTVARHDPSYCLMEAIARSPLVRSLRPMVGTNSDHAAES